MQGRILVGRNIRRIRVSQAMPQERLAYDAGVDRSYLGGMERGEENPTVDVLERIAVTLAVPLRELFADVNTDDATLGLPRGRKPRPKGKAMAGH
jgi:transcriptional regulator with XRE-family HTH domain